MQVQKYFKEILKVKGNKAKIIPSRYKVWWGGRGGGKSEGIARILLFLMLNSNSFSIVACRESDVSVRDNIMPMMQSLINENNLNEYFKCTNNGIECVSGSQLYYLGLFNNYDKIKGMNHVNIFWYDEASTLSDNAWLKLVPSIRKKSSEIWLTFNPENEEDVVYKTFIANTPPEGSYVRKVSYFDNEFFPDVLEYERKEALKRDPLLYSHIWEGELLTGAEDSYWKATQLKKMTIVETLKYERIVIGVDPATTHKEFSNEYGVVAVGEKNGKYYVLEDASSVYTPSSFAEAVDYLYKKHNADACVVETNAGGDFIKSTLLTQNPFINVLEVRAKQQKALRALPVSNLSYQGQVFFNGDDFKKIKGQMMRMTSRGYQGKSGESPDRLEAMIWAIYELAGLQDGDTIDTVFSRHSIPIFEEDEKTQKHTLNYLHLFEHGACFIGMDIAVQNNDISTIIKEIDFIEVSNIQEKAISKEKLFIINTNKGASFFSQLKEVKSDVFLGSEDFNRNISLDELVITTLPKFQGRNVFCYNIDIQENLLYSIRKYKVGKKDNMEVLISLLYSICDIWRIK